MMLNVLICKPKQKLLLALYCILSWQGPELDGWPSTAPVGASPGSSHAGRDDRNNKMAENEEFRVGEKKNSDCDLLRSIL